MLRVDLKDLTIEVSTMFVDEDEDFQAPVTAIAKISSDKQTYQVSVKQISKHMPRTLAGKIKLAAAISECLIQASAQAEEQLISPVQLSLFDSDGFEELESQLTSSIKDIVEQKAAM